jgi:hypothetical protein
MFDSITPERSPGFRFALRAIFSLGAGAILAFVVPWLLLILWYGIFAGFRDSVPIRLLDIILNLPGVIYCAFGAWGRGTETDQDLYCFVIGLFLNIPYYTLFIFVFASWFQKRQLKSV